MIPSTLNNFLLATIGSSASFIGLLFVAMSFTLPADPSREDAHRKQTLAEGSYIALINIFFVSLVALVPGVQMGYVIVVMSLVGLISVYRSLRWHKRLLLASNAFTIVYSTILYLGELAFGLPILLHPNTTIDRYSFMTLIIFLFAMALARAWELTGVRNHKI